MHAILIHAFCLFSGYTIEIDRSISVNDLISIYIAITSVRSYLFLCACIYIIGVDSSLIPSPYPCYLVAIYSSTKEIVERSRSGYTAFFTCRNFMHIYIVIISPSILPNNSVPAYCCFLLRGRIMCYSSFFACRKIVHVYVLISHPDLLPYYLIAIYIWKAHKFIRNPYLR